MTTYAAAIAARLQGREDEDMAGRARRTKDDAPAVSVWDDDRYVHVMIPVAEAGDVLDVLKARDADPDEDAGQVAGLERELAEVREQRDAARQVCEVIEHDRDRARALNLEKIQEVGTVKGELDAAKETLRQVTAHRNAAAIRAEELEHLLATAYVAREVPWTDVAAGMMTIARDGTPWMVARWLNEITVVLRNGEKDFHKNPEPDETVRVLVPYVTEEQAAGLVRDVLGGTEVGS